MTDAIRKSMRKVYEDYIKQGWKQRSAWQPFNVSVHCDTDGWMTTFHKDNGDQEIVWLSGFGDQYNRWVFSDSEVLDIPE